MTNEQKTWTPAAAWLGRTLCNGESIDVEALASTAAAAGFSREQLNQAASEVGAEPLRKPVGRWRLESSRRDYWQAFTDGFGAAAGASSVAPSVGRAPIPAGGDETVEAVVARVMNAGKAPTSGAKQHETREQLFARRRREAMGAAASAQTPRAPETPDQVYARRAREAGHSE